jgi:hypothetical protein
MRISFLLAAMVFCGCGDGHESALNERLDALEKQLEGSTTNQAAIPHRIVLVDRDGTESIVIDGHDRSIEIKMPSESAAISRGKIRLAADENSASITISRIGSDRIVLTGEDLNSALQILGFNRDSRITIGHNMTGGTSQISIHDDKGKIRFTAANIETGIDERPDQENVTTVSVWGSDGKMNALATEN